jgi:glucoamylase
VEHPGRKISGGRQQGWFRYPINGADQQRGIGPLLGRYPGDVYDGDTDAQVGDHPGYGKSVSNLSWSYASLLSAIRARTAI